MKVRNKGVDFALLADAETAPMAMAAARQLSVCIRGNRIAGSGCTHAAILRRDCPLYGSNERMGDAGGLWENRLPFVPV